MYDEMVNFYTRVCKDKFITLPPLYYIHKLLYEFFRILGQFNNINTKIFFTFPVICEN